MDETAIRLTIEPLEEGGFLATSPDVPGLVAEGRSVAEAAEIAQDVARKLVDSCLEHGDPLPVALAAGSRQESRDHSAADDPVLAQILAIVREQLDPSEVILFGSRARGDARSDSDYDLLVVEEDGREPETPLYRRTGRVHRAMFGRRLPSVDLLLFPRSEFDRWRDGLNHVVARACREGRTVYVRG